MKAALLGINLGAAQQQCWGNNPTNLGNAKPSDSNIVRQANPKLAEGQILRASIETLHRASLWDEEKVHAATKVGENVHNWFGSLYSLQPVDYSLSYRYQHRRYANSNP